MYYTKAMTKLFVSWDLTCAEEAAKFQTNIILCINSVYKLYGVLLYVRKDSISKCDLKNFQ